MQSATNQSICLQEMATYSDGFLVQSNLAEFSNDGALADFASIMDKARHSTDARTLLAVRAARRTLKSVHSRDSESHTQTFLFGIGRLSRHYREKAPIKVQPTAAGRRKTRVVTFASRSQTAGRPTKDQSRVKQIRKNNLSKNVRLNQNNAYRHSKKGQ